MSLPSQSSRNATRSSQVHYRRSRSSPLRKLIGLVVIIFIIVLVWFTFIRPNANKLVQESAGETANEQVASTLGDDEQTQSQPPVIISNSAGRPLPGAGNRPDASQEVRRAISEQNSINGNTPSPVRDSPRTPSSTGTVDIFDAATQQATEPVRRDPIARDPNRQARSNNSSGVGLQIDTARRLIAENNRVGARKLLSATLLEANTTHRQAQLLRDELTAINESLLFSPVADPNDPMTETYKIRSGDSLSRIASRRELATHWKLIARVNQIADPSKIRLGQNIKLVRGPFHAVVHKSAHRLDVFHGSPGNPDSWLFIKSFDVGLGSNDGTPIGEFTVSANKLENPGWVNPRDAREQYAPNDPDNPIGEFWIGLTGVGQYASLTSLGIHGTIDPDSIGSDESMGCVRLAEGEIDVVYELLAEHISRVLIVP